MEQLCDQCSKPYLEKLAAKPIEQIVSGSAVASVFVEQRFGKSTFYVQFGRFVSDRQEMYVSRMVLDEQLEDIAKVASMARKFIRGQKPLRLVYRG